ncbi:Uncharacterised protein [Actinobacillus pleuropneumoniae]|nr:Uncharacterised protein [Actinobacillus pleuropneumoniae]
MVDEDYLGLHGQHIKNSAGILFMVDPLQIRSIREKIRLKFGDQPGSGYPSMMSRAMSC